MAVDRPPVIDLVLAALHETNTQRHQTQPLDCHPHAVLYGSDGQMDSLALVNFIIDLELLISERLGRDVTLADERALSQSRSPFRTVASLAAYVERRLAE